MNTDDTLLTEWRAMIDAYKSIGRRPGRLPLMLKNHGAKGAIERLASKPVSDGLKALADAGLLNKSAEAIVLRHPERFDGDVVLSAQSHLNSF